MSKYCGVCGKQFGNEPKFLMENGAQMCEECYLELQKSGNKKYNSIIDESIIEILENKEQYTKVKLNEILQWLVNHECYEEADDIEEYLLQMEEEEKEEQEEYTIETSGKKYETSKSTVWSTYCKTICYIVWVIFTIIGALIGLLLGKAFGDIRFLIFLILGTSIGFAIGFSTIALFMTFLTLCDNISILTRNTAKILMRLDEMNDL